MTHSRPHGHGDEAATTPGETGVERLIPIARAVALRHRRGRDDRVEIDPGSVVISCCDRRRGRCRALGTYVGRPSCAWCSTSRGEETKGGNEDIEIEPREWGAGHADA